jgi:hypothetical protein
MEAMWLLTTQGFYSVVHRDPDKPDTLLVRARTRADIEALRQQIPNIEPIETSSADYRWRAAVSREAWAHAAAELAAEIDYDNFKNAVKRVQGPDRAGVYSRVWDALYELQLRDD